MEKTDLSASASPAVGPGVPSAEGAAGPHGLRENPRPCNGLSPSVLHPANPGGGSIWSPEEEGPQLVGSRSGLAVQVDSCTGWIWGRGREGWSRGTIPGKPPGSAQAPPGQLSLGLGASGGGPLVLFDASHAESRAQRSF